MKNLVTIIVIVLVLILGVVLYRQGQKSVPNETDSEGLLYINVTDDTADIAMVNDINLEIEKVEVQNQSGAWVTASANSESYDLLALKATGQTKLHSEASVPAGMYGAVRVTLGEVKVDHQTKGTVQAVTPSSEVVLDAQVIVNENMKSSVTLDFLADKSLHMSADGEDYVFAPVIAVESRSDAEVMVANDNTVTVTGGMVNASETFGVDLDGSVKADFQLDSSAGLQIDNTLGNLKFMLGGKTYTEGEMNTASSSDANSGINVNLNGASEGSGAGVGVDTTNSIKVY